MAMGDTPIREALAVCFIWPLDPATGFAMDWDQTRHRHAEMDTRFTVAVEQARASSVRVGVGGNLHAEHARGFKPVTSSP